MFAFFSVISLASPLTNTACALSNIILTTTTTATATTHTIHSHRLEHEDEGMMAHEFIHDASFGQCTCTAKPGLAVWIIILIVLGSLVLLLGVYAFLARRYAWWPFRNRSRGVVEKEDEEYDDEEGDDDKVGG